MLSEYGSYQVMELMEFENLLESKVKLKSYIDKAPDGVFVIDKQGNFVDINPTGCLMLGYSRQEILKLHISDIDKDLKNTQKFMELSDEVSDEERILIHKNGRQLVTHTKSVSLGNGLTLSYVRDITERRLTEKALAEARRRFKLYVDKSPDGIFVVDNKGRYIDVNPAACSLLGYTRTELLQMEISDIAFPQGGACFTELLKSGELKQEIVLIRKDGFHLTVELKAVSLENGTYMAYATDITERKLAEKKLSESEMLFSKIFHVNPNSMGVTTFPEGKYIDVNESFLSLHGYTREEVIGRTYHELGIWTDTRQRKQLQKIVQQNGQVHNIDINLHTKTGRKLTGLFSFELIELSGKKCSLGCFVDLTEKKQIEQEFIRLDRLNLIGEMSASIGHEVRNPMTTVRGFLQLLEKEETNIRKQQYYELMIEELDRANSIITEFLSLAKNKVVKLQPRSLNSLINKLYPLMSSDAVKQDKNIRFYKENIPNIPIDDKEMRQLIINLVKNGLESMSPGGTLTLGTYFENNEVVLFVEDEGAGISADILDKLGRPFVTTKDNGTGLGLAVCYSIANRHNAAIDVRTCSSGTTFYVRFKTYKSQRRLQD